MARQRQRESSTYTIMQRVNVTTELEEIPAAGDDEPGPVLADEELWRDVATVTVPAGSKVETVIRQAVEEARLYRLAKDGTPVSLRVLDDRSGRVHVVSWEQPPARLKIGE